MRIDAPSFNANSILNLLGKPNAAASGFNPATAAGSAISAPSTAPVLPSPTGGLSFDTMLALQSIDDQRHAEAAPEEIAPPTAEQAFLEEAHKTPMERMREQVLEELGLTEEDLAEMSPEERRATEDKIRDLVEQKLRQGMTGDGASAEERGVGQFITEIA